MRTTQKVCGISCAIEHSRALQAKKKAKEKTVSRSQRVKQAQIAFNAFIRFRDKGKNCICCDKPLGDEAIGGAYDCGHYRSVGSAPHLRFDERNAHGQSKYCNRWLNGNAVNYRQGLIKRIGLEAVEELEADQTPRKYTVDELIELTRYYKEKVKELKKHHDVVCSIEGCNEPMMYSKVKLCQKHYVRKLRYNTTELTKQRNYRTHNKAGYQMLYEPGHPLSMANNYVYEHRKIIYDKYGTNLPSCESCGKPTNWETCHIDHIDNDVKNNDISNLRPLCRGCNTKRTKRRTKKEMLNG